MLKKSLKAKAGGGCVLHSYSQRTLPDYIRALLHGQFVANCRGHVNYVGYGRRAIKTADLIIVSTRKAGDTLRSGRHRVELCGFALLKIHENELYVDIVCSSHRQGRVLLQEAERKGRAMGKPLIKLSALPHVVSYYARLGYLESDNACDASRPIRRSGNEWDGYRMTRCLGMKKAPSRS